MSRRVRTLGESQEGSQVERSESWVFEASCVVGGTHELAQNHFYSRAGFGRRELKVSLFGAMSSRKGSGGGEGRKDVRSANSRLE